MLIRAVFQRAGDTRKVLCVALSPHLRSLQRRPQAPHAKANSCFLNPNGKREKPVRFKLLQTNSTDGGLTWSKPKIIQESSEIHLCEPGIIRSPDGKRLAVLLRENSRKKNSHIIFSDGEGESWSEPRELPISLTGDRHTGKYGPDGRLFISFRGISPGNKVMGS